MNVQLAGNLCRIAFLVEVTHTLGNSSITRDKLQFLIMIVSRGVDVNLFVAITVTGRNDLQSMDIRLFKLHVYIFNWLELAVFHN